MQIGSNVKTVSPEFFALVGAGLLMVLGELRNLQRRKPGFPTTLLLFGWRVSFGACLAGALWTPRMDLRPLSALIVGWVVVSTLVVRSSKKIGLRGSAIVNLT